MSDEERERLYGITIEPVKVPERFQPKLEHSVKYSDKYPYAKHLGGRTIEEILDEYAQPTFWESIRDGINQRLQALETIAKWTAIVTKLVYYYYRGDMNSIIKMVTTVAAGWLISKWPALEGLDIAGMSIQEIVFQAGIFLGAWFLPALRAEMPEWLRKLLGWDKQEPTK